MEAFLFRDLTCGSLYRSGQLSKVKHICFNNPPNATKAFTSKGDAGGPIVLKRKGHAVCFIGISNFITGALDANGTLSVFTIVGKFGRWIWEKVDFLSNPETATSPFNGYLYLDEFLVGSAELSVHKQE